MNDEVQLDQLSCPAEPQPASSFIVQPSPLWLTQASLRPLVRETLAHLAASPHPWARALHWVLRSRLIIAAPLLFRTNGLTTPLLPLILLDRRFVAHNIGSEAGRRRIMHTLLHEAAHQLWAVWPEWRNWIGDRSHYGPERNAADAVAEGVIRSFGFAGAYAGREISYISPLRRIGLLKS